uniref:C2 domain-containing protein n=1 Tax=Branchiostoma floridae TaxID=7739 RepID=C3YS06_BRAFL|eukprot:XP_002600899.1 hypothetical protein BRAFLDRAFT_75821 [Branchiostoma floridae]
MSSQNVPGDSVFDEVDPGPVSTSPGTVELIARHDYNKGALEVTVVRARLKEDAVWNQDDMKHQTTIGRRTIDPYVKVALGGTTLTTKVASKTYTPMFNDTFQFDSENITYDSVLHVADPKKSLCALPMGKLLFMSVSPVHCTVYGLSLCEIASVPARPGRPERASSLVPHVPTASSASTPVPTRLQVDASDGVPFPPVPTRPQTDDSDGVRPSLKHGTPPRPSLPVRSGRGRRN